MIFKRIANEPHVRAHVVLTNTSFIGCTFRTDRASYVSCLNDNAIHLCPYVLLANGLLLT